MRRSLVALTLVSLAVVLPVVPAAAKKGVVVTSVGDAGPGTLRQALADAEPGATISFALPDPSTISLTSGELVVAKDVTIAGPGASALTIDANGASRGVRIAARTDVTIADLTIANGLTLDGGGGIASQGSKVLLERLVIRACTARFGGGILNDGETVRVKMTIVDTTIVDNATTVGGGGGIYNDGSGPHGTAKLTVVRSTLAGNVAPDNSGGGIYNDSFGHGFAHLDVVSATVSGNTASEDGGGILNGGYDRGSARLRISNCTFSGNVGAAGGAVMNDQVDDGSALLQIANTVLVVGAGGTVANDGGDFRSIGFNLASDAAGGDGGSGPGGLLDSPRDRRNTDALLGPLQDNGGYTRTHALGIGSPAIDRGNSKAIVTLHHDTDQRGYARVVDVVGADDAPRGNLADVGAFEEQGPRDLAIGRVRVPSKVKLRAGGTTTPVRVELENRSATPEIIFTAAHLAKLFDVDVTSLGMTCGAPTLTLSPKTKLPRVIKTKQRAKIALTATFTCANDPKPSTKKDPGHDDFRWSFSIDRAALDGVADSHGTDDVCPRPGAPGGVDVRPGVKKPFPDVGCGGMLPGHTFGGDLTTDVIAD